MLRIRIASAVVMGAILLAALLFLPPQGWALFALVVLGAAAWEWAGFARAPIANARWGYTIVISTVCAAAALWTGLYDGEGVEQRARTIYLVAALFWLLAAPVWLSILPGKPAALLVLVAGLLALVPAYVAILELRQLGAIAIILVMAIAWVADIAAYFAGHRFGRRKLAPAVSPGKTWEGAIGGMIAVAAYALVAGPWFRDLVKLPQALVWIIAGAIVLGVLSVIGDLFESAMKRQAGLKDSGHILPGHGGLLDRIDALLPILPLAALVVMR